MRAAGGRKKKDTGWNSDKNFLEYKRKKITIKIQKGKSKVMKPKYDNNATWALVFRVLESEPTEQLDEKREMLVRLLSHYYYVFVCI